MLPNRANQRKARSLSILNYKHLTCGIYNQLDDSRLYAIVTSAKANKLNSKLTLEFVIANLDRFLDNYTAPIISRYGLSVLVIHMLIRDLLT